MSAYSCAVSLFLDIEWLTVFLAQHSINVAMLDNNCSVVHTFPVHREIHFQVYCTEVLKLSWQLCTHACVCACICV